MRCGKKGGGWVRVVLEWTGNNWGEQKRKREADVKQEKKKERVDQEKRIKGEEHRETEQEVHVAR